MFVSTLTHEPLTQLIDILHKHVQTCTLKTPRTLLNFKVIGQGHMSFLVFFSVCTMRRLPACRT